MISISSVVMERREVVYLSMPRVLALVLGEESSFQAPRHIEKMSSLVGHKIVGDLGKELDLSLWALKKT